MKREERSRPRKKRLEETKAGDKIKTGEKNPIEVPFNYHVPSQRTWTCLFIFYTQLSQVLAQKPHSFFKLCSTIQFSVSTRGEKSKYKQAQTQIFLHCILKGSDYTQYFMPHFFTQYILEVCTCSYGKTACVFLVYNRIFYYKTTL